jgi:hypothetical protein
MRTLKARGSALSSSWLSGGVVHTTEGDYFFNAGWLSEYLRHRASDVRGAVEAIPEAEFRASDDDTLVARVLSELRVEPLVLDTDSIQVTMSDDTLDASKDSNRAAHVFRMGYTPLPATRFEFTIPFAGTPDLWALRPNTFGHVLARGFIHERGNKGVLSLVFTEPKDSKEDLQQKLKGELELIDQNRDRQRPEVEAFNTGLRDAIVTAVKTRRDEFASREELAKRMGVKMRPREPDPPERAPRPPRPPGRSSGARGTAAKEWDVFLSYAGEDREAIAKPLAEALRAKGLRVWFDKFELTLGDRLRRMLDEGLANSKFGVVVLSPAFFGKHWPQTELDGLAQREVDGEKVILPVWHGIDREDVARHSPTLADRVAASSSEGIDHLVASIMEVTGPPSARPAT